MSHYGCWKKHSLLRLCLEVLIDDVLMGFGGLLGGGGVNEKHTFSFMINIKHL